MNLSKFQNLMNSKQVLKDSINETSKNYRTYDPALYLYRELKQYESSFFSEKKVNLIYTTMIAWGMNSRGAKLAEYDNFKKSLTENWEEIDELSQSYLEDITDFEYDSLENLYDTLDLTQTKSKLVSFSKAMHFLTPNLVAPIDRKYTMNFFYGNIRSDKDNFETFKEIHEEYKKLAKKQDLHGFLDNKWNRSVPKVADNAVIGYMKLNS